MTRLIAKLTAVMAVCVLAAAPCVGAQASPAHASPAPASRTVTITGRAHWTIFIGAVYLANGYRSGCASVNGALTLWGGAPNAHKVAVISRHPVTEQHTTDAEGNQSWLCHMDYRIHAPREPKYAIDWNNTTPYENEGCTNSKQVSDAKIWNQIRTVSTHRVPTIGFTYLCTDDGY